MDLGDRGSGNRLLGEVVEERFQLLLEVCLDRRSSLLDREGRQAVLERREVGGDRLAQQIGARGEALAELDEGRPHLLECRRQSLARSALRLLVDEGPRQPEERARLRHQLEGKERVVPRKGAPDADHPPSMLDGRQHQRGCLVAS